MYSSNETSEVIRRDRRYADDLRVTKLSTRTTRDDLLVCQINPTIDGYLPDGDQRPRFLRCFPVNSNITVASTDIMMIFNPEQGSTVIGARYVYDDHQQKWVYTADISVSASLENFVESKMVSSAITIFSDTISTTNTVLSGRISTVCTYDVGNIIPSFENIGQYSIGPKYSRINQSLAEGVVFITPPNSHRASSLTETSLLDGVSLPSILNQQPIATIDIPPNSNGSVFHIHAGLYALRGKPFYMLVSKDPTHTEPALLNYVQSVGVDLISSIIPSESQLLYVEPNSHGHYLAPQTHVGCTISIYTTDPLLYNDSHLKTVAIIQGNIGTKNINISGNVRYELIPKAANIQQTAFTPIIAYAPHVFEAFQLMLRDCDFFSLVYSRVEYARVLMLIDNLSVSDIADQSTQGVASFALLPFIKKGVGALKNIGIEPGKLLKKGLQYGGQVLHKGLDRVVNYADEGVGRLEKLGYATYGTATGLAFKTKIGPVVGSLDHVSNKGNILTETEAIYAITTFDLMSKMMGFSLDEDMFVLFDSAREWEVYVNLRVDVEKEHFWVVREDKYSFRIRPNPSAPGYVTCEISNVAADPLFGLASFTQAKEDQNMARKRVRLEVKPHNPLAGKIENPQVEIAAHQGISDPIPEEIVERSLRCKAQKLVPFLQNSQAEKVRNEEVVTCSPFICVTADQQKTPILAFLTVSNKKMGDYHTMFEGKFNVSTKWAAEDISPLRDILKEPMLFSFLNGCATPIYVDFYLGSLRAFGSISWFGALFNALFGKCPLVIFEATVISLRDQTFWVPVDDAGQKSSIIEMSNDLNLIVYKKFFSQPVTVIATNTITLSTYLDHEANGELEDFLGTTKVVTIDQVMTTGIVCSTILGPINSYTIKAFTNSELGAYMASWKKEKAEERVVTPAEVHEMANHMYSFLDSKEGLRLQKDGVLKEQELLLPDADVVKALLDDDQFLEDMLALKGPLLSHISVQGPPLNRFRNAKQLLSILTSTKDPEKMRTKREQRKIDNVTKAPQKVERKVASQAKQPPQQPKKKESKLDALRRLSNIVNKATKPVQEVVFDGDDVDLEDVPE